MQTVTTRHTIIVSRPLNGRKSRKTFSVLQYLAEDAKWDNWIVTISTVLIMAAMTVGFVFKAVDDQAKAKGRSRYERRHKRREGDSENWGDEY